MRSIWTGNISFGLVNIPISLHTATKSEELKFRLLRKSDLSPVNYKRVAEADGKEVPWDEIVKGYEYEKGRFVILKDEDFKRVDVEATQSVDIIDFVEIREINPMFFDKPYYLSPQKSGVKAYALLRDALRETGRVGIAKVVIRTRQHLAAVKPNAEFLILELMHFADELTNPDFKVPARIDHSHREMDMAKALIDKMSGKWNPEKYTDDYREGVLKVIHEKIEAGGELPPMKQKQKKATNVIDLVEVLQKSLDHSNVQPEDKQSTRKKSTIKGTKRKVLATT